MVQYYYDKYNAVIVSRTYSEGSWGAETPNNSAPYGSTVYPTYEFSPSKGFTLTGTPKQVKNSSNPSNHYSGGATSLTQYSTMTNDIEVEAWQGKAKTKYASVSNTYGKGSLVQSNITAEDGTYPANGRHTDGFWYVRKGVTNQNPVITPSTVPSGSMEVKPSFIYTVTDPDGDTMSVTESIDGIPFNTRTSVASGSQLTFTLTDLAWLCTRINQAINITITSDDGNGGVTTVNYPITRTTPAIDLQLKTPFETDVAARRLLLQLHGEIPIDAVANVQACNNAFDVNPTWENATNLVLSGFPYPFTNTTKTATKWGVSFKVRVERGSSVLPIYIDGIGGAFD